MKGKHLDTTRIKKKNLLYKFLCIFMIIALIGLMIPNTLKAQANTETISNNQGEEQGYQQTASVEQAEQLDNNANKDNTTVFNNTPANALVKFYLFSADSTKGTIKDDNAGTTGENFFLDINSGQTYNINTEGKLTIKDSSGTERSFSPNPLSRYSYYAWLDGNTYKPVANTGTITENTKFYLDFRELCKLDVKTASQDWGQIKNEVGSLDNEFSINVASGTYYRIDNNVLKMLDDSGKTFTPAPKTGCEFVNWVDENWQPLQKTGGFISKDRMFYAQFKINFHQVTFDPNNGQTPWSVPVEIGGKVSKPSPDPEKTGYTFDMWVDADGKEYDFNTTVIGDITLTAIYTANEYSIAFDKNKPESASGTVSGNMDNLPMTYDVGSNLTKNAYSLTGWAFTGWNNQADGKGTNYSDEDAVSNLTSEDGDTVILYAQWTANTYTVKFDKNEPKASGTMEDQTFSYDTVQALQSNKFIYLGYFLEGWSDTPTGEVIYKNGEKILNLSSTQGDVINLYAKWAKDPTKVSLSGNIYKINTSLSEPIPGVDVFYQTLSSNETFTCVSDENGYYEFNGLPKGQAATITFTKDGYLILEQDLSEEFMSDSHTDIDVELRTSVNVLLKGLEGHDTFKYEYTIDGVKQESGSEVQYENFVKLGTVITLSKEGVITAVFNDENGKEHKVVITPVCKENYIFESLTLNGQIFELGTSYTIELDKDIEGVVSYAYNTPVPAGSNYNIPQTSDNLPSEIFIGLILLVLIAGGCGFRRCYNN